MLVTEWLIIGNHLITSNHSYGNCHVPNACAPASSRVLSGPLPGKTGLGLGRDADPVSVRDRPPPDSFPCNLQCKALEEAFRRNGWELEIRPYPRKMEVVELVSAGKLDGDVLRVSNFTDNGAHPGYVKIDVEMVGGESGAYALSDLPVSDWQSLKILHVPIGYIFGEYVNMVPLKETLPPELLHGFVTQLQGLQALANGTIKILIATNHYSALAIIRSPEFRRAGIRRVAVMAKGGACAYFARKHADKVPALERALEAIKLDGTFHRFLMECMGKSSAP